MHCASCAITIEKEFRKTEGVTSADVNFGTETVKTNFDEHIISAEALSKKIEPLGYGLIIEDEHSEHVEHAGMNAQKEEKLAELAMMKRKLIFAIPLSAFGFFVIIWDILAKFELVARASADVSAIFGYALPLAATWVLFVVGKPYLLGVYRFLRYGKANMDTLIGIGTSVAYLYSVITSVFARSLSSYINVENLYFDVVIVVITFVYLGEYLESKSKLKTGDAIEKLLNLQAKFAIVIRDPEGKPASYGAGGKEIEIPISDVVHGDLIVIKPAGKIPVDGVITEGSS
jgi:Cu2+-exporting ATPase/Cu+-exporting ATPase